MDIQAQAAHERQRALAQISDYDSEPAGYGSEIPMKDPPERRTTEELNISVIQRIQPEVAGILSIAPYAVIYEFETIPQPAWEKKDIEGSLFICQLTPGSYGEDRYSAIVLNRRGLKNFDAPLIEVENGGVEVNDPYVIITFIEDGKQKIYGVFIFSEGPGSSTEHTRTLNGELMVMLANQAGLSRKTAEAAAAEAQARHTNGHVQEAGENLPEGSANGQQSLQQLFGQQRAQDAGYSGRTHHLDGSTSQPAPPPDQLPVPTPPSQQQQTNVLMDLFRGAGGQQHPQRQLPQQQQPQQYVSQQYVSQQHQPQAQQHSPQPEQTNALLSLLQGKASQGQAARPPPSQQPNQQSNQQQQPPNVLADLFRQYGNGPR